MVSETVYRTASDVVVRRIGDESVVVPVRSHVGDLDSLFTLNEVASRVWELLDGRRSLDAIIETLCEEFDVTAEVAAKDVEDLIRTLEEAHLVQAVEG
ncbi:MAG TPA: PqqD family protein [Thermoanaerobaculia bacterium]|jgi:hypothetical protein